MTEAKATRKATIKHVLTDVHVRIESGYPFWHTDIEKRVTEMESWASGLMDFFNDHRHQDVNAVEVVR